jgi:6,7-dimethyl-8-ribityllumazine synthase
MKLTDTGIPLSKDACVVLVRTEWNAALVDELETGCRDELRKNGIKKIITITVPGAFEIPFGIKTYWQNASNKKRPDAFIALGCVIRGNTPHFDYICQAVTEGLVHLNMNLPVPSIFGVLTVENEMQAKERVGGKHGHNGRNAALSAIKMILLNRSLIKQ